MLYDNGTQKVKINPILDFRLLDVSLEVHALEDQFDLILQQISYLKEVETSKLDDLIQKDNLSPEDPEWHMAQQEYDHTVEVLYPRFFWGPFIVALYAVYETAVIEIAKLIQQAQNQQISINDLKGGFLERANKYYKHIINFELCNSNVVWERLKILSEIRHAIAHTNGRTDMLNKNTLKKIRALEQKKIGVSSHYNFLILNESFTKPIFDCVRSTLEDIVERYKDWDTKQKNRITIK